MRVSRPWIAALIAFPIAMIILAQGISAPFVKDAEPQAAQWIQSVASGRNILIPRDYYGELGRKPPLFHWTAAAIADLAGGRVTEVNSRIVSVVAGAAIAIIVLTWTAASIDNITGWIAFLFLLGSYAFTSRGTLALEDMMLVMFMFWGWCLMYRALEARPSRSRIVAIGILLGLGILTKGPVAIVLPAFGALIYLLLTRRPITDQIHQPWPWMVIAISIAIALPWYVPALLSHGGELARIIFQENAGHFLPASAGGTGEAARPFYYILVKMIGGTTPLNFLLPALVAAFFAGGFTIEARKPILFQMSFLLAMLIFFSVASAKRDDYVLAGVPSLAILFAALFTSLKEASLASRLRDLASMLLGIFAIGAIVASAWVTRASVENLKMNPVDRAAVDFLLWYASPLNIGFVLVALAILIGAALIFMGVLRGQPWRTAAGLGAISVISVLMFTAMIRPELSRERTLKYAATDIDQTVGTAPLYTLNEQEELSFYLGRAVPNVTLGTLNQIAGPAYLFAYPPDLRAITPELRSRLYLVWQWERLGKAGPPALYRIHRDESSLKPSAPQDK